METPKFITPPPYSFYNTPPYTSYTTPDVVSRESWFDPYLNALVSETVYSCEEKVSEALLRLLNPSSFIPHPSDYINGATRFSFFGGSIDSVFDEIEATMKDLPGRKIASIMYDRANNNTVEVTLYPSEL